MQSDTPMTVEDAESPRAKTHRSLLKWLDGIDRGDQILWGRFEEPQKTIRWLAVELRQAIEAYESIWKQSAVAPVEREEKDEIDMCEGCEKEPATEWAEDAHLCAACFEEAADAEPTQISSSDTGTGVPDNGPQMIAEARARKSRQVKGDLTPEIYTTEDCIVWQADHIAALEHRLKELGG